MRNIKHKICEYCLESYQPPSYCSRKTLETRKYCSNRCKFDFNKGKQYSPDSMFKLGHSHSEESKQKMSNKGKERIGEKNGYFGKKHTEAIRLKISQGLLKGNPRKAKQERNDSQYCWWRDQVRKRDNFMCKIRNEKCSGKIIAHHILSWSEFPELRYQPNNGIVLCQAHHPLRRAEEKRLSPFFQELVSVSSK